MKNYKYILLFLLSWIPLFLSAQEPALNTAQLANQYLKSGNYQKSSVLYLELYNKHKSNNYYQGLIESYLGLNNLSAAEKLVKKYTKRNTTNPNSFVDYAHILQLIGEENKANTKFEQAHKLMLENTHFIGGVANKLYKYGYLDRAIEAYKLGLQDPKRASYNFQLARIYGEKGDLHKMFEAYAHLVLLKPNYLQSVKNSLNRLISTDSNDENNQILKTVLIQWVQENDSEALSELLIWLFIQEKSFEAALDQEIALDKRFYLQQKNIYQLAQICRQNKAFGTAKNCYNYILNLGTESPYFLEAQLAVLSVDKELLESNYNTSLTEWETLSYQYMESLNKLGKTSYTILLIRDLAQIQAFRLHNIEAAEKSIQEALEITTATDEELAACKLIYADILLLQNEIWDAIIQYSQVDKAFKHDLMGHEAKFRRAKISYYQGDFDWAQAQLDVLKKSTSKLIANNAMELSLLIQDNLNLDTVTTTMEIYARADLNIYQNKLDKAYSGLDSIIIEYAGHSLVDEALYKQSQIKLKQGEVEHASELLDQIILFYSFDILADDAKFTQAKLQEDYFNNSQRAVELYEDIMMNHKDSFFLAEARKRYRQLSKTP